MPYEIITNLWIGDHKDSLDNNFLKDKGINVIINATRNLPFYETNTIKQIRVPVDDEVGPKQMECNEKMFFFLTPIVNQIHKFLLMGKKVLVHCRKGRQRSATIICAFLMKYGKMKYMDLEGLLKSKKQDIFYPSCNFRFCLQKFQGEILSL